MTFYQATMLKQETAHRQPMPDWLSLFAGVGMMALLGLLVDPGSGLVEPQTLGVVAGLGYILGFILAELHVNDLIAHFVALLIGALVAIVAAEPRATWGDIRTGAMKELAARNIDRFQIMADAIRNGDPLPDHVASAGMSLTIWLVGYGAAWMLFRRGWYVLSIALPASVMLTSFALDRSQDTWPLLGFTGLAIAQGASTTVRARNNGWAKSGLRGPRNLQRLAAVGGIALACIVVATASHAALSIPQNAQDWVVAQSQDLADTINEQIDQLPNQGRGSSITGNYGEFADEFKVGDGVASGETLIASLRAADRHYLAARKFNKYDGSGWISTVGDLPDLDGVEPFDSPPRIAFGADQEMHLPASVTDSRTFVEGEIQLLGPSSGLLLTLESHLSISSPTSVQVGWQAIDEQIAIDSVELNDVPLDLRSLVGLLKLSNIDEDALAAGTVSIEDSGMRGMIEAEIEGLRDYPVVAEIGWDADQGVVLIVRGRLPVYTDVEAVFSSESQPVDAYVAIGLVPNIGSAMLADASRTYPDHVIDHYLQLPDTVTPRTRELAAQIVADAGATNPYAMARAIETYLRSNFTYLLEAGPAPDGRDIVDYFLFDSGIGRCDHFASAMAVMLRSLGVPARIVTGFAPVDFDTEAQAFQYRSKNAHAWVEVYFSEYGWIPFEPTPSQDTINLEPNATSQQGPVQPTPTPQPTPSVEITPTAEPGASPVVPGAQQPPTPEGSGGSASFTTFPGALIPILLAVAALLSGVFLLWRWPLRDLNPAASVYYRLQRLGSLLGVKPDGTLTPSEYAARYGEASPRYEGAAISIAQAYTDERYGTPELAGSGAERGFSSWKELRRSVFSWRPWRRKGG